MTNGATASVVNEADSRIYYKTFDGDFKKYLVEGEESSGGETGLVFSKPQFLYLNSYEKIDDNTYTFVLGDEPPSSQINLSRSYNSVPSGSEFFSAEFNYTAGDDFELTPNDKLDMVITSPNTTYQQIIICELYIDSVLIRRGKLDSQEELAGYNFVNNFNLIKLNEIVNDRKITGSCALNLKLKFFNGKNSTAFQYVRFSQPTAKIFKQANGYYCGLQKNLSLEDYYCYGRGFEIIANLLDNLSQNMQYKLIREEFSDSFNNMLYENYIFTPNSFPTDYLQITGFYNNSMIIFNTDPNNDFTYNFSIDSGWKISKPFNFEKGKSYCIATEGYCIFWCEVQNYE